MLKGEITKSATVSQMALPNPARQCSSIPPTSKPEEDPTVFVAVQGADLPSYESQALPIPVMAESRCVCSISQKRLGGDTAEEWATTSSMPPVTVFSAISHRRVSAGPIGPAEGSRGPDTSLTGHEASLIGARLRNTGDAGHVGRMKIGTFRAFVPAALFALNSAAGG